jgi:hypothetical protein
MNKLVKIIAIFTICGAIGYAVSELVKLGFRIVVAICY